MSDFSIQSLASQGITTPTVAVKAQKAEAGFGEVLQKSIASVNSSMQEAEGLVAGLVSGQHANIHETMIAMEKASVSFRMLAKVQNKVVEAYKEIMRMQV